MRFIRQLCSMMLIGSCLLPTAAPAQEQATAGTPAAAAIDPLSISIDRRDADRFAAMMAATGDRPTAEQVQRDYLDGAGRGVAVFTPNRIENASNLATAIAANVARYRYAIDTCLPLVDGLNAEMRSVYLAYRGLLPERPLPTVHVVFGAGTSGGTASADAQVIGLEVMCGPGTTPQQFRTNMRSIFAHETPHSWQSTELTERQMADPLVFIALREGVPDYLASLVTGAPPSVERENWARGREGWLWSEFQRDQAIVRGNVTGPMQFNEMGNAAFLRWFGNYGAAPEGWPSEAGYWVGMRIAQSYVERSPERAAAIRALITLEDPAAILAASGYNPASQ
jgi:hypothetical protein